MNCDLKRETRQQRNVGVAVIGGTVIVMLYIWALSAIRGEVQSKIVPPVDIQQQITELQDRVTQLEQQREQDVQRTRDQKGD